MGLISTIADAWSFNGHVIIAQIAYDNLTSATKQKADQLAAIIFIQLPLSQQEKLDQKYATASTFAKIAIMPDVWRKWKLQTIFTALHAPLPNNLLPYANQATQSLHFINLAYPAKTACLTVKPYNVVWAINQIQIGLKETNNINAQAVLMTLEEHYVGDVHQPLHVLTNVNGGCRGDAGGNDFCLKTNGSGQCTKSLHSVWDNGVGYIKPKMNIAKTANRLERLYPKSQFAEQLQDNNAMSWAKTNYGYASFIYHLPPGQKPSPEYYHQGQVLATTQMALAGYRLAKLLDQAIN